MPQTRFAGPGGTGSPDSLQRRPPPGLGYWMGLLLESQPGSLSAWHGNRGSLRAGAASGTTALFTSRCGIGFFVCESG